VLTNSSPISDSPKTGSLSVAKIHLPQGRSLSALTGVSRPRRACRYYEDPAVTSLCVICPNKGETLTDPAYHLIEENINFKSG
jgi:hypothetical protein